MNLLHFYPVIENNCNGSWVWGKDRVALSDLGDDEDVSRAVSEPRTDITESAIRGYVQYSRSRDGQEWE